LSVVPVAGVIAAGGALDLDVVLDAGGLVTGAHGADVVIGSNDPDAAEVRVPIRLWVSDPANIVVAPDTLAAVSSPGRVRVLALRIANQGSSDLNYRVTVADSVGSASSPPRWVTVSPSEGVVAPEEYGDLRVRLDARGIAVGSYRAELMVAANDPVHPVVRVPVRFEVVNSVPRPHIDPPSSDSTGDQAGVSDPEPRWVPAEFAMGQSRPNPFGLSTTIVLDLPTDAPVRMDVFDVRGDLVVTLVDQTMTAGRHSISWNGRDVRGESLSAGVYFCRITAGAWTGTQRLLLIR
jgi:hypothetical protein